MSQPVAPPTPSHPAARLREIEGRARRRFGQNFLVNPDSVDRIVAAAGVSPGARVLEIGPGLGILTSALLRAGADLVTVELDRDLAAALRESHGASPNLKIIEGDALRVDLAEVSPGEGWLVAANLPYNDATPILMRFLGEGTRYKRLVLMFQREVGDRLEARADDDAFGALSVQVQARASVSRVLELPPGAFHPAPKVWSVVLAISPHVAPDYGRSADGTPVPAALFDRVVRAGFQHRRKTLTNSLGAVFERDRVATALAAAGIHPGARAETVDLPGWRRLAGAFAG